MSSWAVTVIDCPDPPWVASLTWAPSPIQAWVRKWKTSTMTEPVTVALPVPAPPAMATEETAGTVSCFSSAASETKDRSGTSGFSWPWAVIEIAPTASIVDAPPVALESTYAWVWMSRMFTTKAPPTAFPLMASAPAAVIDCRPTGAVAAIVSPWEDTTCEPAPIEATLWRSRTWIAIEAATLALASPPAAEMPQPMKSFSWPAGVVALTVTPAPARWLPPPTVARLSTWATLRETAAPTTASEEPVVSSATPIARAVVLMWFWAITVSAPPVAVIDRPPVTSAWLLTVTQLTPTAAATSTLPLESPDWLLEVLLPWLALSLKEGRLPVWPLVFGLSFDWWPACWSALLLPLLSPLEVSPRALAFTSASPPTLVEAEMVTEVPVMSRAVSAVLSSRTTLTAMMAPTATLLPTASASPEAFTVPLWLAITITAPVAVRGVPEVPRRAVVTLFSTTTATAGAMALPPLAPALTTVVTGWAKPEPAIMVTLLPPTSATPSSTSARVMLGISTSTATEAPMPELEEPPVAFAAALTVSSWMLPATRVTSPVPALTLLPVGM